MYIGVKRIKSYLKWSVHNGMYWTNYVTRLQDLIHDIESGDDEESSYQDYTPVMPILFYRWNDDC